MNEVAVAAQRGQAGTQPAVPKTYGTIERGAAGEQGVVRGGVEQDLSH